MSGWACLQQPDGCHCHCHAISAARKGRASQQGRRWTREQDAALTDALGRGLDAYEAAALLNGRFKTERTVRAVTCRASDLDRSARDGWLTRAEIETRFTVNHRTIARWISDGVLPARRHVSVHGVRSRWWRITLDDLLTFVDAHAGELFDPRSVRDPALRARAEVAAIARSRRSA